RDDEQPSAMSEAALAVLEDDVQHAGLLGKTKSKPKLAPGSASSATNAQSIFQRCALATETAEAVAAALPVVTSSSGTATPSSRDSSGGATSALPLARDRSVAMAARASIFSNGA